MSGGKPQINDSYVCGQFTALTTVDGPRADYRPHVTPKYLPTEIDTRPTHQVPTPTGTTIRSPIAIKRLTTCSSEIVQGYDPASFFDWIDQSLSVALCGSCYSSVSQSHTN